MSSVMDRLSGRKRKSAYKAKERLQLVLIHDRTNLPSNVMETMKDEIIDVISRRGQKSDPLFAVIVQGDTRLVAEVEQMGERCYARTRYGVCGRAAVLDIVQMAAVQRHGAARRIVQLDVLVIGVGAPIAVEIVTGVGHELVYDHILKR